MIHPLQKLHFLTRNNRWIKRNEPLLFYRKNDPFVARKCEKINSIYDRSCLNSLKIFFLWNGITKLFTCHKKKRGIKIKKFEQTFISRDESVEKCKLALIERGIAKNPRDSEGGTECLEEERWIGRQRHERSRAKLFESRVPARPDPRSRSRFRGVTWE